MTFLSVFQIVSNKSIPRKRPREVALSTFQTFGFPIPFSLLPVPLAFLISCDAGLKISGMAWGWEQWASVVLQSSVLKAAFPTACVPQTCC